MRFKYLIITAVLVLCLALAASCAPRQQDRQAHVRPSIVDANTEATDKLLGACNVFIDYHEPIIVTSLVDIDNMRKSSTLGRMSSEMIANRLAQHGYQVREVKMGDNIFVSDSQGEFILSRDLQQIGKKHEVQGFVVGTYAVSDMRQRYFDPQVSVSLRFVDTDNNLGCTHNYVINNTDLKLWQ